MNDLAKPSRPPLAPPERAVVPPGPLGNLHLLGCIGRGGMGEVHLALLHGPASISKLVVVKLLREHDSPRDSARAMFLDEGRLAARLNHPNVVQTNDVGVEGGRFYLVMEYLEGQPLDRLMKCAHGAGAPVPPGLWVRVALDVLAGLEYAHEVCDYDGSPLGVVHRDLSPHNVFLTYEGQVKVLDFGIAKAATQSVRTGLGSIKGKLNYMAPEQMMGQAVDRRSDLFGFGVVLWEMFAGARLFQSTFGECLRRVTSGPLPRVSSVVPGFDPGLDAIVAQALAFDPAARFATAQAMREALLQAASRVGPIPSNESLGELVRTLFREQRERRQLAVRRYVNELPRGPAAAREARAAATPAGEAPGAPPSEAPAAPRGAAQAPPETAPAHATPSDAPPDLAPASRPPPGPQARGRSSACAAGPIARTRRPLRAGALALVALALTLPSFWALHQGATPGPRPPPPSAVAVAAPPPLENAAPSPAAPSPAAPSPAAPSPAAPRAAELPPPAAAAPASESSSPAGLLGGHLHARRPRWMTRRLEPPRPLVKAATPATPGASGAPLVAPPQGAHRTPRTFRTELN